MVKLSVKYLLTIAVITDIINIFVKLKELFMLKDLKIQTKDAIEELFEIS